ncbi:MAG TPA: glycosyltransferase family 4 protein [Flavobacteriales bacterium]|nr:glycosyltransferase family 4 protein [Flavobacteriales bacterium]
MEIIHIALGKVNPQRMNGVNKVVYNLATEQAKAGVPVQVWGISHSIVHDYPERNFKTVLFQKSKFPFFMPDQMKEAIRSTSNDVVFHLHGGFIPVFYSIARFLHAEGKKFIFTPHGSYNRIAWRKSGTSKAIYFRLFEQSMLQKAAIVHVLGKSESDGLNQLLKGIQIQRVPYGFELFGEHAAAINPASSNFLIGFCGRVDIYTKGLDVLLDAFALFLHEVPTAQLWIIGDGPERASLEQRADSLGIKEKITFWGSRFGAEKDGLLAQLNLFVHPSRNEGLPTAVLEAASMGIPCLISEATNLGDEIRQSKAGIVISDTNKTEMLEGLIASYRMYIHTAPQELQVRSRSMVESNFNWKKILSDFNSIYQRALSI